MRRPPRIAFGPSPEVHERAATHSGRRALANLHPEASISSTRPPAAAAVGPALVGEIRVSYGDRP
ncbi:hypothetical protein OHA77_12065 [Streptosporangium sp. NBC_01639]|uniref:hypothetical protein n=1 Tax=Streptosporangium sp. NBC_01639 TaxID=2975948 RepID=UPI003869DEEF|nr:hypothetical protein OHA77_12065 [Streptosporangium sp. NBC_01639]